MKKRYPRTLSSGANNTVIAISETEVGKIFTGYTRTDIGSETEKMKFANGINDLVVKFIRLDEFSEDEELLVMERLHPLDFRTFEQEKREVILSVFEDELIELHKNGFVHRDLRRPSDMPGFAFDNIFLTQTGIRLIDVGISILKHQVSERLFDRYIKQELEEFEIFRTFFLSR
jgi:tRNA A-37 threonylcarbamoyl transferase component Bud32